MLEYALNRETPFTAAIAFENIDVIETVKHVSDSLGRLYHERILARRRVDKVRYEYIRAEIRPVGFEMALEQQASEPKNTRTWKYRNEDKKILAAQNQQSSDYTASLNWQPVAHHSKNQTRPKNKNTKSNRQQPTKHPEYRRPPIEKKT